MESNTLDFLEHIVWSRAEWSRNGVKPDYADGLLGSYLLRDDWLHKVDVRHQLSYTRYVLKFSPCADVFPR